MIYDLDPIIEYLSTEVKPSIFSAKIAEHDELMERCNAYIADANTQLVTIPFSPFKNIKTWREKRNDDRLSIIIADLTPKISDAEKDLRSILMDAMMKKEKLQAYAHECYMQLLACIDFTNMSIFQSEPIVTELRAVVDHITLETDSLKNMVAFNTEIVQQIKIQYRLQAQAPAWGSRVVGSKTGGKRNGRSGKVSMQAIRDEVAKENCNDDPDNQTAIERLRQLRTSRMVAMDLLASSLESKEVSALDCIVLHCAAL